jgi:hypothetical protein
MVNFFLNEGKIVFFMILSTAVYISCSNSSASKISFPDVDVKNKMVGVKIYSWDNAPTDDAAVAKMVEMHANTAFVDLQVAAREGVIKRLKNAGLDVFVIVPVFLDEEALEEDSDLCAITDKGECAQDDWLEMICPTRENFIKKKIEQVKKQAQNSDVAGISLDFIRHFTFWENVYPDTKFEDMTQSCFDDSCVTKFAQTEGIDIPEFTGDTKLADRAGWILANQADKWTSWKTGVITDTVKRLAAAAREVRPDIKVNLHAVPWRTTDYNGAIKRVMGQDFAAIGPLVDYIQPMTYAPMVKRDFPWIADVTAHIANLSKTKTVASIQVAENGLTLDGFVESIVQALKAPSAGVVFYSWKMLISDKDRFNAAKEMLAPEK